MIMVSPPLIYEPAPRIPILETERIRPGDLNSPVLFIVKNDGFGQIEMEAFAGFLTPEETERSRRFRHSGNRESYILVHGLLREILGGHLGIKPASVQIGYNSFGRPFLTGYPGNIFFNLSHSSGLSVLAFDPLNEIGVDTEYMDADFEYDDIVNMFFSGDEKSYIRETGEESRSRFYEIWTRKEAFLKALGIGITEHLKIEVLRENQTGTEISRNVAGQKEFFFRSMVFENNYRITVATGSGSGPVRAFVLGKNGKQFRES